MPAERAEKNAKLMDEASATNGNIRSDVQQVIRNSANDSTSGNNSNFANDPVSASDLISASNPGLNEDIALALLKLNDLSAEVLQALSKNSALTKSRKVKMALAAHQKTPRHISMPLLRHLFTFDLMQVSLAPATPADVKRAADEALVNRLESTSQGERLSLARRGSARVAGALLLDSEPRIFQTALENSRLTEASVVKAVMQPDASPALVQGICHHSKWSLRREIRIALLRSQHTPMARAVEFARGIPFPMLKEILQNSKLPAKTKSYLLKDISGPKPAAQK